MNRKNIILSKSFKFALSTVQTCRTLMGDHEYILSKQLMRCGTSVGANIKEAQNAESKRDFIHKMSISQKECSEAIYWIELLYHADLINMKQFDKLNDEANEIMRILTRIIVSSKKSQLNHS